MANLGEALTNAALPVDKGGTGSITALAAFDTLSPTGTKGDLIVHNGTDSIALPTGTNTHVLTADSTTASGLKWAASSGGGLGGSGTTNYLPKFTPNGTTLGDSIFIDDGTKVGLRVASPVATLDILQAVVTTGSPTALLVTSAAHTTLTASTESVGAKFNLSATKQFSTGALTTQREAYIQAPTYSFVGASTITTGATLAISGAPIAGTNATITNKLALFVESGDSRFVGNVQIQSTDAGATMLPFIDIYRNSASPADGDLLGGIKFTGKSSTAVVRTYAQIKAEIYNKLNADEAGALTISVINAGYFGDIGTISAWDPASSGFGLMSFATGSPTGIQLGVESDYASGEKVLIVTDNGDISTAVTQFSVDGAGNSYIHGGALNVTNKTINTTAGTSATINASAGRFRKDTTGTTFTLTNSLITANSIILLTYASDPTLASQMVVTAAAGSATINFSAAPLANTDVNFLIIN